MMHEALTGEQLFGFQMFPPDGAAGAPPSGMPSGGGPQMSTGGAADADRGYPIRGTHSCGGDACPGRGLSGGIEVYDGFAGGGYGCAPVTLGWVGDRRLVAALVAANGALGLVAWAARRPTGESADAQRAEGERRSSARRRTRP
jgi:hypothetical protein